MRQPVINILLGDTFPGLLPDNIPSYGSMFVKLFHPINQDITFNIYQTWNGELPKHPTVGELYLITGSNNAAYDTLPWILDLQEWIRKAAEQQIPLVGICNHHDQVTLLPEGTIALATSDFCRYEGFRIGRHILTFQGHPEFTVEYERHLILNHAENEDAAVKRQALESLETMLHQGKTVAEFLLDPVRKL